MVMRNFHRLSRILLTCPAHVRLLTCLIMSVTVFFSYPNVCFLSRFVMFNIHLSIFVCAAASLFFARLKSAHVSTLCIIVDLSLQACVEYHLVVFEALDIHCSFALMFTMVKPRLCKIPQQNT